MQDVALPAAPASGLPPEINVAVSLMRSAYDNAGWLGVAVAAVPVLVNAYRSSFVQGLAPARLKWDALPGWLKLASPVLTALGTTTAASLAAGFPIGVSLTAALPAGLVAAGYHEVAKFVSATRHVERALSKMPESVRKAASLASVRTRPRFDEPPGEGGAA